jgi:hypothetical protein
MNLNCLSVWGSASPYLTLSPFVYEFSNRRSSQRAAPSGHSDTTLVPVNELCDSCDKRDAPHYVLSFQWTSQSGPASSLYSWLPLVSHSSCPRFPFCTSLLLSFSSTCTRLRCVTSYDRTAATGPQRIRKTSRCLCVPPARLVKTSF